MKVDDSEDGKKRRMRAKEEELSKKQRRVYKTGGNRLKRGRGREKIWG